MVSVRPPSCVSNVLDKGNDPPCRGGGDDPRAGQPAALLEPGERGALSGAQGRRRRSPRRDAALAAEGEPSAEGPVTRGVLLHQIRGKAAALADELEEAAARMVVLREAAEMFRKVRDPLRQERDLDLR